MGALRTAVLLLWLLHPAFPLTQRPPGLLSEDHAPGLNLTFDPWAMNLTWACSPDTTSLQCGMTSPKRRNVTMRLPAGQCHCAFRRGALLHGGAEFKVTATRGRRRVTARLSFANAGGRDTAAQNVSCLVYKADFLNCTWAKGPAAPDSVQYFLHLRDLGSGRTRACPRYLGGAGAPHTGCHLQGASAFGPEIYVLVNGSSPEADVQFFDATLMLRRIEIYDPPDNITVECNASHCLVQWDTPKIRVFLSNSEMQYQLDIHRQNSMQPTDHQLVDIAGGPRNAYVFQKPLPRAGHSARMRAADGRLQQWGPWSRTVQFGSGEWASGQLLLLIMVIPATLVCVLISLYLFKRFVEVPVPRVKDKMNSTDDEINWEKFTPEEGTGDQEAVFPVEEVGESPGKV